jgi:hypothetical protein
MRHRSRSEMSGRSATANLREGISHSIGNIKSTPCTIWKGENPVAVLIEVRYAQSVGYSMICQLDFLWLTFFYRMVLRDLFMASTYPFSLGVLRGIMTMLKPHFEC